MTDLAFTTPTPLRPTSPPFHPPHQLNMSEQQPASPSPRFPRRRLLLAGVLATFGLGALRPGSTLSASSPPLSEPAGPVRKSPEEWRATLSGAQFRVLRQAGTERPFSSPLNAEKRPGTFRCAACGHALFSADTKYDSGTGWPSFFQTLPEGVTTRATARDRMLMQKEVLCKSCEGHLGHVFQDGPRPTGLRYCMNGVALSFEPAE